MTGLELVAVAVWSFVVAGGRRNRRARARNLRLPLLAVVASSPAAGGARLTGRLSEPALVRAIGCVLLVAGSGAGAAIHAFV